MLRLLTLGRLELQRERVRPDALALQPKRLALLTYLALSPVGTYHRRDILLALLWPERRHAEARHALRHALYHLRQALGEGVLARRGNEEVGLAAETWCDARTFEHKLDRSNLGEALTLYRGDFLAGVFIDGASAEWEEWVSQTRARLRNRAAAAAWMFAEQTVRSANVARGLDAAWRARELDPDNEGGLRWLMRLLDQHGQRPAALHVYSDFARRMHAEYQADPAMETKALADAIRSSATHPSTKRPWSKQASATEPASFDSPPPDGRESDGPLTRRRSRELARTWLRQAAARRRRMSRGRNQSPVRNVLFPI